MKKRTKLITLVDDGEGNAILALPTDWLKSLGWAIGDPVEVSIEDAQMTLRSKAVFIKSEQYKKVEAAAIQVFGNESKAHHWLTTTHAYLGMSPRDYLDIENGENEMLRILYSIGYGGVV